MPTIVIAGALANKCGQGGAAWTRLSWILGFRKLGFDVLFVEEMSSAHRAEASVQYFFDVTARFGLNGAAALVIDGGAEVHGVDRKELFERVGASDLLVNISGHLRSPELLRRCRRKAFVDLDPGFTQMWHEAGHHDAGLDGHDLYFTVGENIGTPECSIPTAGIRWRAIRQPVLLNEWPVCGDGDADRFTTVASWRGAYGPATHNGVRFGVKAHEFRRFLELPLTAPQTFEIALDIHPGDESDRTNLVSRGWKLVDPGVASDPWSFRRYVQTSGAEWSAAQGIYVDTRSGWFSDRTVRYLASGKPALVQDTGFGRRYPVGEGLLAFSTLEDARAGAARIARDYDAHCLAARAIAEEHFDSDKVLSAFVDEAGLAS